jgi:hypothetical protein
MPDVNFRVEGAAVVSCAATPILALTLRVDNSPVDEEIQAILLACQVRIDAERRGYALEEQDKLRDLFGEPALWTRSLRALLWTQATATVQSFCASAQVEIHLPCSFDLSVASTKYFYALEGGEIPLTLLFSGTAFYRTAEGLQVAQIPRDREATCRLKVAVWKDLMAAYYPNHAFLAIRSDVFDRLYRYKVNNGLPTWEHALERLLVEERGS